MIVTREAIKQCDPDSRRKDSKHTRLMVIANGQFDSVALTVRLTVGLIVLLRIVLVDNYPAPNETLQVEKMLSNATFEAAFELMTAIFADLLGVNRGGC